MRTLSDALEKLYQHAEPHMAPEDLDAVASRLLEEAKDIARNASDVMGGLAALVAHDGEGEHAAGNFQNAEDLFPLLWLVSQQFQTVAALVQVGNDARLEARPERRKTAATQAEPKKGRFEP